MTLPSDAVLRDRHLKSALGHIQQAVIYTEGLAGRPGADIDTLYQQRAELKHLAQTLTDIVDNQPSGGGVVG